MRIRYQPQHQVLTSGFVGCVYDNLCLYGQGCYTCNVQQISNCARLKKLHVASAPKPVLTATATGER